MHTTGLLARMLGVLACTALVFTSVGASAQDEAASDEMLVAGAGAVEEGAAQAAERQAPSQVEEIVVTSRKREERLQEVPISITAFSEVDLQDRGIRRLEDVMHAVPNLMMDSAVFAGGDSARTYMRGVGNGNASARDNNGTGIYLDGVFIPRAQGQLLAVSDIERVEVLRGPQGTLFGKNTIGGAINVITQKPRFDFGGYGEVRLGNYQRADTRFSVNIPLSESIASRFSFATRTSEGYMENKLSHNDFNDDKLLAARASFLWNVSDDLEVLLTLDGAKEDKAPAAQKCNLQPNHLEGVREVVEDGTAVPVSGTPLGAQVSDNLQLIRTGTGFVRSTAEHCLRDEKVLDEHEVEVAGYKKFTDLRSFGSTLTVTWELSESLTLKSTSGWRGFHRKSREGGYYPYENQVYFFGAGPGQKARGQNNTYSQELLLTGSAMDGRLDFSSGIYWFSEENQVNSYAMTAPYWEGVRDDPATTAADPTTLCGIASATCGFGSGTLGVGRNNEADWAHALREFFVKPSQTKEWVDNLSYAAFGEFTFDVTDKLSLTAGARYMHERRRIRTRTLRYNHPAQFSDVDFTADFSDPANFPNGFWTLSDYYVTRAGPFLPFLGRFVLGAPQIGTRIGCLPEETVDLPGVGACAGQYAIPPRERSSRYDAWTPRLNLKYQFTDNIMAYVTWSRGWKSGLWDPRTVPALDGAGNLQPVNPIAPIQPGNIATQVIEIPVEPEWMSSWEVGLKSSFFDNRLTVNLAYFRNTWEDAQLTVVTTDINNNVTTIDENAGKALIHGQELELRARPIAGLTLTASIGHMNARYREFQSCSQQAIGGRLVTACTGRETPALSIPAGPLSNNNLPGTPAWQWDASVAYVFPLMDIGDVRARVQWSGETQRTADILDQHFTRAPKHGTLSARLSLDLADGRTEIALWGQNLLDRAYFTNAINITSLGSLRNYAPPRTYGIEVRRTFGTY